MKLPDTILRLKERAPELQERLIRWANQNSGSANTAGLAAMFDALAQDFSRMGRVDPIALAGARAPALQVKFRPDAPLQVLFSGHYDTVYGPEHPFQSCAALDGPSLRGPGVADMKGGLVVMLAALECFNALPEAGALGGEIVLTPDEEIGSPGSRAFLVEAASRHDFALVFEPARENGNLVRARMGVGHFVATCRGRSAHASQAALGRNAVVALAEFVAQTDRLYRERSGVLLNVSRLSGGSPANVVPDHAEAEIGVRVSRLADGPEITAQLEALAAASSTRDGLTLSIAGGFNRGPKVITPSDERLFAAWQSCAANLGFGIDWQDVGGGSDGNLFSAAGLPTLDGLGPVGGRLHSPDEYILLPTLVERAQVAALFLSRAARGELGPLTRRPGGSLPARDAS